MGEGILAIAMTLGINGMAGDPASAKRIAKKNIGASNLTPLQFLNWICELIRTNSIAVIERDFRQIHRV